MLLGWKHFSAQHLPELRLREDSLAILILCRTLPAAGAAPSAFPGGDPDVQTLAAGSWHPGPREGSREMRSGAGCQWPQLQRNGPGGAPFREETASSENCITVLRVVSRLPRRVAPWSWCMETRPPGPFWEGQGVHTGFLTVVTSGPGDMRSFLRSAPGVVRGSPGKPVGPTAEGSLDLHCD